MKSREQKKIEALARQYRRRGYTVYAEIKGYESPRLFGGFVPDLIASSNDETIIVEVITAKADRERTPAIEKFARIADQTPNTRFDLVVVNPPFAKQASAITVLRESRTRLVRDLELIGEQFPQVFPVLLASAIEQLLLDTALRKRIEVGQFLTLPVLATTLAEKNVISPAVKEYALSAWTRRNLAVHGQAITITREDAKSELEKFIALARDYDRPTRGERSMADVYVEARPKGRPEGSPIDDYVVETDADHVLGTFKTQKEAIDWAKANGHHPLVARVRHLNNKKIPDHWRSA
jgi:hypothetical protein